MKKALRLKCTGLVVAFFLALFLPTLAFAQVPDVPAAYWGMVTIGGQPAPKGTEVVAKIDGVERGRITVEEAGKYGSPGPLGEKLAVRGTAADEGKTVVFEVGGVQANETVVFYPRDFREVNLTVSGTPQPPQDTTPPVVVSTDPADDATNVPVNKTLTVTFSEDVQEGPAYDAISLKDANNAAIAVTKSIADKVLTIRPNANLAYNTKYTVTIPAGAVKDLAGNALAEVYSFSFTTQAAPAPAPGPAPAPAPTPAPAPAPAPAPGPGPAPAPAPAPPADKVEKPIQVGATTVAEISGRVKVEVPAGAVTGANAAIKAEVVGDEKAAGAGMPLLSKVVDITLKNGTLTGKITIILYFDKTKLGKDQDPAAFYYDEKAGRWVRLPGVVDADKGTVTVTVDRLAMFAVFGVSKEAARPEVVTFKDMASHWAEETVGKLADMGVISGYEDGTFRPDNEISRAEITAILVRALKLPAGSEQDLLKFKDRASIPDWARGVVAAAAKEGLVRGYPQPDGTVTFEPGRPVSRAEMAALVVRILEKKIGPVVPAELKFADAASIPDWAKSSVGAAVAKGIVVGYPDNTFRPQKRVTRAEAAAMILRMLEAIGSK